MKKQKKSKKQAEHKVRYAVMGLGHIAQVAVLPAFQHAKNSELVALISEDEEKLKKLGEKYNVPEECQYRENVFPSCLTEAGVDVLYLCTPNHLHTDFVIDAMEEGVHVLCEKPLAISVAECDEIIRASEATNCQIMTAYRLHFEEANLEAAKIAKDQLGELRIFNSTFTMQVKDMENIRLNETYKGGGPLWDIGIYCINAVRGLFRDEPTEVFAMAENNGDPRFELTDEMVSVMMRFPKNRLATFTCSFGADACATYDLVGTKGRIHLEKAFEYAEKRELCHLKDDKEVKDKVYKKADQFAAEITYFSDCLLNNKVPEPSAHEGKADVRIIKAILKSLDTGSVVRLKELPRKLKYPQPQNVMKMPPVSEPDTVNVRAPH